MTLDKERHRKVLLELIDTATFPGIALDVVLELRNAIRDATATDSPVVAPLQKVRKKA